MRRLVKQASHWMQTVLCSKIESILNSWPLTLLSADSSDLSCNTPGHFLVDTMLKSVLISNLTEDQKEQLLRWQWSRFVNTSKSLEAQNIGIHCSNHKNDGRWIRTEVEDELAEWCRKYSGGCSLNQWQKLEILPLRKNKICWSYICNITLLYCVIVDL